MDAVLHSAADAGSGWSAPRLANALIVAAAGVAAWRMARSAPLLALTALPVVAEALARGPNSDREAAAPGAADTPWRSCARRYASRIALGIAILLNLVLLQGVVNGWYCRIFPSPIAPTPFGFDEEARYHALRSLQADGLRGPVFTDYNLGSLVEYELYPEPGYVDNRPEAFPAQFWRDEYLPALGLGDPWARLCSARGINAVIVSLTGVKEGFTQELTRRPEWVLVHLDSLCAAWVRNTPANQALIARRRFDERRLAGYERSIAERLLQIESQPCWRRQVAADRLVYECYGLVCIGQGARAWPYVWQLHRMFPDYQVVHELMRVTAPPAQAARVAPVLAARARWPLAAKQVLDEGRFLEAVGSPDVARQVYRRGRCFFPLSPELRAACERRRE